MDVMGAIAGSVRHALYDAGLRGYTVVDLPHAYQPVIAIAQGSSRKRAVICCDEKNNNWWYELWYELGFLGSKHRQFSTVKKFDLYRDDIEAIIAEIVIHMLSDPQRPAEKP